MIACPACPHSQADHDTAGCRQLECWCARAVTRPPLPDPFCGGCDGKGAHRRWCRTVVGPAAAILGRLAANADALADSIGGNDPDAANHCYAAAGILLGRALAAKAQFQTNSTPEGNTPS